MHQTHIKIANNINTRDFRFAAHNQQQLLQIRPDYVKDAATKIKPAGSFSYSNKIWEPNRYQGYAVVSMLNSNPGNEELSGFLMNIQQTLIDNLQPVNAFYMLPPDSFHQTIANTLSAGRYEANIMQAGMEPAFPGLVKHAFNAISTQLLAAPIHMQLIGLSVFSNAIGILGVFENEHDYNCIKNFRTDFYDDKQLAELDVRRTRPFIGHITLAYAEQKLNKNQKEHLATTIDEINEQLSHQKKYFLISNTGLRQYDHLAEFRNAPDFPVYQFTL